MERLIALIGAIGRFRGGVKFLKIKLPGGFEIVVEGIPGWVLLLLAFMLVYGLALFYRS